MRESQDHENGAGEQSHSSDADVIAGPLERQVDQPPQQLI
jgi:hypothetical protein